MAWYNWSQTAATNATADATINWAEGQAPSSVNDSARAMMAATAKYRDDIAGGITTGGSSTAYTVTSFSNFDTLAHLNGQLIGFVPNATSTNAVGVDMTVNVDSLGAKPLRLQPGVAAPSGTFISGTPYLCVYNNADGAFYLQNMLNPYVIPLGAGMDYWGSTTPNSSFAFPAGQAISRTTYATAFSLLGTTYGAGDGSTTFNLPDKTGRVSAMKEASATRLTSTYFGGNSTTLGAVGGGESSTLVTNNLPAYTPSGTLSINAAVPVRAYATSGTNDVSHISLGSNAGADAGTFSATTSGSTFTGTAQGGTSTPVRTVPPTIVCNYIIRII